jgi:hypothetical protein
MWFHSLCRISQVLWLLLAHRYRTWFSGFTTVSFQTKMGNNYLATTVSTRTHAKLSSLQTRIPTERHACSHPTPHKCTALNFPHTTVTFQSYLVLIASNKHPTLLERERASVRYMIYLLLGLDHAGIMTARALGVATITAATAPCYSIIYC